MREELDQFVKTNWSTLMVGATRLGCYIAADYYAPERVQIGSTRLHARHNIKYAGGHKYNEVAEPTSNQIRDTVADLQRLLDAAAKEVQVDFELRIISK